MSANERSSDAYLTLLEQRGEEMNFFQSVRLLERSLTPGKNIRYKVINSEAFHPNFVAGVVREKRFSSPYQATVSVNGFGTTGAQGPIPHCFAEMLQRAEVKGRKGREDPHGFLDIFHDRIIALLYEIKKHFNPMLFNEQPEEHSLYTMFSSICGFSLLNLFDRLPVKADELCRFAPVLANRRLDYSLLFNVVKQYLGMPVRLTPNQGAWRSLPEGFQAKLSQKKSQLSPTQSMGLGNGIGLGKKYWDCQAAIQYDIYAPDIDAFHSLLPQGQNHKNLCRLLSFLSDAKFVLRVNVHLDWQQVPKSRLTEQNEMKLDSTSWLKTGNVDKLPERVVSFEIKPSLALSKSDTEGAVA